MKEIDILRIKILLFEGNFRSIYQQISTGLFYNSLLRELLLERLGGDDQDQPFFLQLPKADSQDSFSPALKRAAPSSGNCFWSAEWGEGEALSGIQSLEASPSLLVEFQTSEINRRIQSSNIPTGLYSSGNEQ